MTHSEKTVEPVLTHFALRSTDSLINIVYPTWTLEDLLGFSEWCLRTLYEQVDRFYMNQALLMERYCSPYAHFIQLGGHMLNEFRTFSIISDTLLMESLSVWRWVILSAPIVDKMQ
jgi:hypothetical protein